MDAVGQGNGGQVDVQHDQGPPHSVALALHSVRRRRLALTLSITLLQITVELRMVTRIKSACPGCPMCAPSSLTLTLSSLSCRPRLVSRHQYRSRAVSTAEDDLNRLTFASGLATASVLPKCVLKEEKLVCAGRHQSEEQRAMSDMCDVWTEKKVQTSSSMSASAGASPSVAPSA